MNKEEKLNKYCHQIIDGVFKSHPYFLQAMRKDGTFDVQDFQNRYKRFLDTLSKHFSLSEREKDVLLSKSGFYGHQYTNDELGKKYNITGARIQQIGAKALRRVRGGVHFQGYLLDSFFLDEYDRMKRNGLEPKGLDQSEMEKFRYDMEERMEKLRRDTEKRTEKYKRDKDDLSHLGLPTRVYYSLRRGGVNSIDELKKMSDDELLRVRHIGQKGLAEIHGKLSATPGSDDTRNLASPKRIFPSKNAVRYSYSKLKDMIEDVISESRKLRSKPQGDYYIRLNRGSYTQEILETPLNQHWGEALMKVGILGNPVKVPQTEIMQRPAGRHKAAVCPVNFERAEYVLKKLDGLAQKHAKEIVEERIKSNSVRYMILDPQRRLSAALRTVKVGLEELE